MKGKKNQGKMYSPNESGEYTPCGDVPTFTVQGLRDTLIEAEVHCDRTTTLCRRIHYSIGSDYGRLTSEAVPTSLLVERRYGVTHALKSDPSMRDLEHVQVDGPGLAYLFLYYFHGYRAVFPKRKTLSLCSHIVEVFTKWIGRSACFDAVPLLLEVGQQCTTAVHRKGTGNVFNPWRNPFYQYMLMSLVVLDHHSWWVECPQSQRPRRGLWNRKHLE